MMISTNDFTGKNLIHFNQMIDRHGWTIAEAASAAIEFDGLDAEEAISEAAQTTYGLGALFTALLSGGYINEDEAFETILHGLQEYIKEA